MMEFESESTFSIYAPTPCKDSYSKAQMVQKVNFLFYIAVAQRAYGIDVRTHKDIDIAHHTLSILL
jgi:hypothetical protein